MNKCIDCKKILDRKTTKRCQSCYHKWAIKVKLRKGKKHWNFKNGKSLINHYCTDCNKLLKNYNATRCLSCAQKEKERLGLIKHPSGKKSPIYGIIRSKLTKQKLSQSQKKRLENPKNHPFFGKKLTKIHKKHISISRGGTGIPYEHSIYPSEFNIKLKMKIRKRDKYKCQRCGKNGKDVHHIDYNKHNCNENNLITLCDKCNNNANYDREYWYAYFMYIMENYIYG